MLLRLEGKESKGVTLVQNRSRQFRKLFSATRELLRKQSLVSSPCGLAWSASSFVINLIGQRWTYADEP